MERSDMEIMRLLQNCSGYPWKDKPYLERAAADPSLTLEARRFAKACMVTKGFRSASGLAMASVERPEKA